MNKPAFRTIPIKDLTVSLDDFQGRAEAYSSVTYNRIKDEVRDGTFNFSALPAIMVWKDTRTNKWVILAGHSRTAAFSDLSKGKHPMDPKYKPADFKEIHAQVFIAENKEEALEQARKVAQESNLAGQQSDIDFAFKVVRPLRAQLKGNAYWDKMENLFGANKRKIHKLSFLNPDGKVVHMLRATENLSDAVQQTTIKTIAEYIGLARERLSDLTDAHEDELYDWLVKTFAEEARAKKEGRKLNVVISSESKFLELVSSRMLRLGWNNNQPLNLDLVGAESVYKTTFDQTKKEKIEKIKELQDKYNEDKKKLIQLNWSTADIENKLDPQELYIIRLQRELAAYENKISEVQAAERSELSLFDSPAPVIDFKSAYLAKLKALTELMRISMKPAPASIKVVEEVEQKIEKDDISEAWQLIKPEIDKVKKELPGAHDYEWWRSRVSEFFYQGALKKVDWAVKSKTEKLFPQIWERYKYFIPFTNAGVSFIPKLIKTAPQANNDFSISFGSIGKRHGYLVKDSTGNVLKEFKGEGSKAQIEAADWIDEQKGPIDYSVAQQLFAKMFEYYYKGKKANPKWLVSDGYKYAADKMVGDGISRELADYLYDKIKYMGDGYVRSVEDFKRYPSRRQLADNINSLLLLDSDNGLVQVAETIDNMPMYSLSMSHFDQYKSMFKNRFDFSVLEAEPNGLFLIKQLDYWLQQFEERMQFYHGVDPYNKRHTKGFRSPQTKYTPYLYNGKEYDPHTIREETGYTDVDMLKQICETAIHIFADSIIGRYSQEETYSKLCDFYAIQPRVIWRTTKSMQLQQYSTPIPMAYLMSKFCIKAPVLGAKYLEPSAGTGLLTIGTPPDYWTVNEIDKDRLLCLKFLGFKNTFSHDGTMQLPFGDDFDAIITNPPFDSFEKTDFKGYQIKKKEFVMAANALKCMKPTGKAAIIVGSYMKYDDMGYISPFPSDGVFFNYLYHYYNVVDVITCDADLYKRMGANAHVRIILIDGWRSDMERLVHLNRIMPPRQDEIKHLTPDQQNSPHFVKDYKTLYQRFNAIKVN